MSTEIIRLTALTNSTLPGNAYDSEGDPPSTKATIASGAGTVKTGIGSTTNARVNNWSSYEIKVYLGAKQSNTTTTEGGGVNVDVSIDGGTNYLYPLYTDGDAFLTTTENVIGWLSTGSINGNVTPSQVRLRVETYGNVIDILASGSATAYIYDFQIVGTILVASPTISNVSLTNPKYGETVTITGTGFSTVSTAPTISGYSASSYSVVNDTTITASWTSNPTPAGINVTNSGGSVTGSQTVTVQIVSITNIVPTYNYTTGNTNRTYSATVSGAIDTTINWSCGAGSITSGGVWTAPAAGSVVTIIATSAADSSKYSTTTSTTVVAPVATSCIPTKTSPLSGEPISVTAVFSNGTAQIGSAPNGNDVTSNATSGQAYGFTVGYNPSATVHTLYLTVTNLAGDIATASSSAIIPQTITISAISPSNSNGTVGQSVVFTATVSGAYDTSIYWSNDNGTGSWSGGGNTFTPSSVTNFTIRAISVASNSGNTVVQTTTTLTVTASVSFAKKSATASS